MKLSAPPWKSPSLSRSSEASAHAIANAPAPPASMASTTQTAERRDGIEAILVHRRRALAGVLHDGRERIAVLVRDDHGGHLRGEQRPIGEREPIPADPARAQL